MQIDQTKKKYINIGYLVQKVFHQNKEADKNHYLKLLEKNNNKYTSNLFKKLYPWVVQKCDEYQLGYDDLLEQTSILLLSTDELNNVGAGYYFVLGMTCSDDLFKEINK
ncbi:hypothetical protein PXD04_10260 [Methanosphaera sp. ISO3-F5]|uniref:hypothetical protein n=1 Tax=Methanosphaera sp. ISO3-F5 TaxID=1452353 RepID=UPI002B25FA49|nr:hypothetical protein [Methanosphaera sp. ISO3-F5]WQH64073.1 hypothetical protein PXD04_10260 [Methanosphaera sp. ISO3-F5]